MLRVMKRRTFIKIFSVISTFLLVHACVSSKKLITKDDSPLFSFIFCNDIHINKQEHATYFTESITNWNSFSEQYDFIVICGDLVEYGQKEEFALAKKELDRLTKPYYTVLGNHDVSGEGDEGKKGYRETFGADMENYIIQHNDVALMFLDLTDAQRSNVAVKQHSVDWLKNALSSIPQKMPIIVFSHFPLHPENPKFPVKNSSLLFDILDKREVLAYFSGHYHGKWQGERNSVDFFGNTSFSMLKNNYDGSEEEGYLFVQVYKSDVKVSFIPRLQKPY
jgi:predicted phosphodiesterase